MSIAVHITAASQAQMERAMRGQIQVLGREPHVVVDKAYRNFAASGGRRSPGGRDGGGRPKKYRQVIPNPKYLEAMQQRGDYRANRITPGRDDPVIPGAAKWLIVVKHQNKADTYVPTNAHKGIGDKRRIIGKRGLMRKTFSWAVGVGVGGPSTGDSVRGVPRRSVMHARRRLAAGSKDPFVELTHRLMYLLTVKPNIGDDAMQAAARGMQHQVDNRLVGKMERAWANG